MSRTLEMTLPGTCVLVGDAGDRRTLVRAGHLRLGRGEQARWTRLRCARRRAVFLVGHHLAREAVAALDRMPHGAASREDRGRAWVDQDPDGRLVARLGTREVGVSLSHCGDVVVAAAHAWCECGVDVERLLTHEQARLLDPWVLGADEHPGCSPTDPRRTTLVWSAKEALAKATGVDLAHIWRAVAVNTDQHQLMEHGGGSWQVELRELPDGLVVALAVGDGTRNKAVAGPCRRPWAGARP